MSISASEGVDEMLVRYFQQLGRGPVHSCRVDEQGKPEGPYGGLCGAYLATLTDPHGDLKLMDEVLPWAMKGKRCPRCAYVEQARQAKAWERPPPQNTG